MADVETHAAAIREFLNRAEYFDSEDGSDEYVQALAALDALVRERAWVGELNKARNEAHTAGLLGHLSSRTTLDTYVHVRDESVADRFPRTRGEQRMSDLGASDLVMRLRRTAEEYLANGYTYDAKLATEAADAVALAEHRERIYREALENIKKLSPSAEYAAANAIYIARSAQERLKRMSAAELTAGSNA